MAKDDRHVVKNRVEGWEASQTSRSGEVGGVPRPTRTPTAARTAGRLLLPRSPNEQSRRNAARPDGAGTVAICQSKQRVAS